MCMEMTAKVPGLQPGCDIKRTVGTAFPSLKQAVHSTRQHIVMNGPVECTVALAASGSAYAC